MPYTGIRTHDLLLTSADISNLSDHRACPMTIGRLESYTAAGSVIDRLLHEFIIGSQHKFISVHSNFKTNLQNNMLRCVIIKHLFPLLK